MATKLLSMDLGLKAYQPKKRETLSILCSRSHISLKDRFFFDSRDLISVSDPSNGEGT